jgi:hypothetical protein
MKKALLLVAALIACTPAPVEAPEPPYCEPPPACFQPAGPSKAEVRKQKRIERAAKDVKAFVKRVAKNIDDSRAVRISKAIAAGAIERHIDPMVVAAIIAQESHFRRSLYVCHPNNRFEGGRACDAGIGQVNWQTWGAHLSLDRHRLVHDDAYNVGVVVSILSDLKRRFGRNEETWWTRYHDSRPEKREAYFALVARRWSPLTMRL